MTFYIYSNSGYCSICLSEIQNNLNNKKKESNKFLIRNLSFRFDNNLDYQTMTFDVEEAKLSSLTKINQSIFNCDLLFSAKKESTENFKFKYTT